MDSKRLYELANGGSFHDMYFINEDEPRLYPAFGLEKITRQNQLRQTHHRESLARLSKSLNSLADISGRPEKEADWAIMGGLAQGIGGVGAGIAAAAQTQVNNMAVRQRNAQRAANAATLRSAASNVGSVFGAMDDKLMLTPEEISCFGASTQESTDVLFAKLRFVFSPEKQPLDSDNALVFSSNDHVINNGRFNVAISSTHSRRIDGYVLISMKDKADKIHFEKIIPLPLMGVGATNETSQLTLSLPNGIRSASFRPLALWEVVDHADSDAPARKTLSDLPAAHPLSAAWKANLDAYAARLAEKKRKDRNTVLAISGVIAAVVAVCVLIFSSIFTSMNNDHYFEMGQIGLFGDPAESHYEYFSKLPKSYHERVADEYIDCAESALDGFILSDKAIEHLGYASRYAATQEQQTHIRQLYIKAYIGSNEQGAARDYIQRQYSSGALTADQVVEYAQQMYDFVPDFSSESNNMQADALSLVNLVKDVSAAAAQFSTEWDAASKAHAAAIEQFNARDYLSALTFFSEHTDVEYGWEYMGFCKAASDLFGTWKDARGNILTISYDPAKDFEYMMLSDEAMPYKMYLKITLNGEDISYFDDTFWAKRTVQCALTLNVYESLEKVTYSLKYVENIRANPYRFDLSDDGILTVTHNSEPVKKTSGIESQTLWSRPFTRAE